MTSENRLVFILDVRQDSCAQNDSGKSVELQSPLQGVPSMVMQQAVCHVFILKD